MLDIASELYGWDGEEVVIGLFDCVLDARSRQVFALFLGGLRTIAG